MFYAILYSIANASWELSLANEKFAGILFCLKCLNARPNIPNIFQRDCGRKSGDVSIIHQQICVAKGTKKNVIKNVSSQVRILFRLNQFDTIQYFCGVYVMMYIYL